MRKKLRKQVHLHSCLRARENSRIFFLKYPAQFGQDPVTRGDWRLKNDFITKILKPEGFGFINREESTIGRTITD